MTTLTRRKAVALATKYATANPERLAEGRYVNNEYDGETGAHSYVPECIVGQIAVNDLGLPPEDLEGTYANAGRVLVEVGQIGLTSGAALFLDTVQRFQDGRGLEAESRAAGVQSFTRLPWGEALSAALVATKGRRKGLDFGSE